MSTAMCRAHFTPHKHGFVNKAVLLWNLSRITKNRPFGQAAYVFNDAISMAHFSWCQTRLKIYEWGLDSVCVVCVCVLVLWTINVVPMYVVNNSKIQNAFLPIFSLCSQKALILCKMYEHILSAAHMEIKLQYELYTRCWNVHYAL